MNVVMKNVVKVTSVAVMLALVSGCAGLGGMSKSTLNNKAGTAYGILTDNENPTKKSVCDIINNADPRCLDNNKYNVARLIVKHGLNDRGYGFMVFSPANIKMEYCSRPAFESCTYYKAEIKPGEIGTIVEVASNPKELKCDWSGLNMAGGTICPAYNYNYNKDFKGLEF